MHVIYRRSKAIQSLCFLFLLHVHVQVYIVTQSLNKISYLYVRRRFSCFLNRACSVSVNRAQIIVSQPPTIQLSVQRSAPDVNSCGVLGYMLVFKTHL